MNRGNGGVSLGVEHGMALGKMIGSFSVAAAVATMALVSPPSKAQVADAPSPLVAQAHPADWWFVFKFNTKSFPGCGGEGQRFCLFGGTVQNYKAGFGQQFAYASKDHPALQLGSDCLGMSIADPVGATFDAVYNHSLHYVIWNDQLYDDPTITGCSQECGSPWGHSKGMVAWDESGQGFVLQVSTPSWPAAGAKNFPRRKDGNTLGCVNDNDVEVSQHFFSLRLTKDDVVTVLKALANASVVTDPKNPQIVQNGGPPDIRELVDGLGVLSKNVTATKDTLSSGVVLISKPSRLRVPPWQMVSALLGGVSLRVASWWAVPQIDTTTVAGAPDCWDSSLPPPNAVEIAATGAFAGRTYGLTGGLGTDFNHAKVGVSTSGAAHYAIFGDMNQQGKLSGPVCASSQNGRGGLFYVVDDAELYDNVKAMIAGKVGIARARP
jgi:hypothetical protein